MQRVLNLRAPCLRYNKQRTAEGVVDWVGDKILLKGISFSMGQLRKIVGDLIGRTRRMLVEELLMLAGDGNGTPPSIPWGSLMDNAANEATGWNFLQDRRVAWPVDGARWLLEHVQADKRRQRQFVTSGGAGTIMNEKGIRRYMGAVVKFREMLLVLTHVAGGQPARGPELLSVRHTNTPGGGHRNIFVEDGYVVLATRHHKGYKATMNVRIIHRYQPREVGELIIWYLWLVLPFQRIMEHESEGRGHLSNHLWPRDPGPEGREWTPRRMRRVLSRGFESGAIRQHIGVQSYRHLAIAIGRKYLDGREMFRVQDKDREGDGSDADVQAGKILDRQACHLPDVAGRVYARLVGEQQGVVASRRGQDRLSSLAWHRKVLGFGAAKEDA
ncbi:hypothetical protein V8E54_001100, partial [Elaphomyces granulatus]